MAKFCRDCQYSQKFAMSLYCMHPEILGSTASGLAAPEDYKYTNRCEPERHKLYFGRCGRRGVLWTERHPQGIIS